MTEEQIKPKGCLIGKDEFGRDFITYCDCADCISRLEALLDLRKGYLDKINKITDLEKENEQLRKQVGKMKNSLNCQTWNEWQCPYARDNNDKDYVLVRDREKCPCDKWRIKE